MRDNTVQGPLGCAQISPSPVVRARVAEFDHIRRNSSSIASDGTQILAALGVLARGLLASPALLNAPAFTLGVATAW